MSVFRSLAVRLRESLAALEPGVYSADDAAFAVVELATTRKACEAAEARLAARAAGCGVHRTLGFADASDWLASVSGSTTRDAEQRRAREVRHWRDGLGMVCGRFRVTPEVGVAFVNRLDAETDRVRRAAKRGGGEIEGREAYAADAFVRMVSGQGKGRAARADVVFACDYRAFQRGHAHEGEPGHVIGGGPVPVSVVREIAHDAFLKVAFHDGAEIHKITHFGRHRPAELDTALGLGSPPDFPGVTCCEPGCERRYGLEWDHVDPVANDGPTSFKNLEARCHPHHREKTTRDRAAGLLDGKAKGKGKGRAPP